MNVNDFKDVEVPEGDMLEGIFKAQVSLMVKYHDIERERGAIVVEHEYFGDIDNRFVQWRIKDLSQRTVEELMTRTGTRHNRSLVSCSRSKVCLSS